MTLAGPDLLTVACEAPAEPGQATPTWEPGKGT